MGTVRAEAINAEIGARIRRYRKALGYSQTDLGRQIGLTFQQIQKYENATNRVSAGCLVQIANALHVPVQHLLPECITGAPPPNGVVFDGQLANRLICAFARISDAGLRKSVIALAESLAE